MEVADKLQAELDRLQMTQPGEPVATMAETPDFPTPAPGFPTLNENLSTGQKIEYLMQELGFDMRTAVAVIEMSRQNQQPVLPVAMQSDAVPSAPANTGVSQTNLVDQILQELEAEIAAELPSEEPVVESPQITGEEYQLISSYFRSVTLPKLEALENGPKP